VAIVLQNQASDKCVTIFSMYVIIGLGNPGEEYLETRHNTGRIVLDVFRKKQGFPEWEESKKNRALISLGKIKKESVTLVEPETFMNKSGASVATLVKNKKQAESLVVIQDDLDLGLGTFKIVFNRGSGGHRGVESIKRAIKTEGFVRVRVGISPATPSGKVKKPTGLKVNDFILGKFKKPELEKLKKVSKTISEALEVLIIDGRAIAMNQYN